MKTITDIPLAQRDREAIIEAVRLLRSQLPVERVILYGSKVGGTDTPESDLDLLVLTEVPVSWRQRDAVTEALYAIELARDVVISTLIVPRSDWEEGRYSVLPIHDEIECHGAAA